jgi:hypothetical protein
VQGLRDVDGDYCWQTWNSSSYFRKMSEVGRKPIKGFGCGDVPAFELS